MRPNILIVMTDQQQAKLRRGAGYELDTMPRLDAFANEGVDFARAYTPNPTCAPARTSLFTGRYPSCHKVRTNHNLTDVSYSRDLIDLLKAAGYQTAICGKNHTYLNTAEVFDFHAESGHLGREWGKDSLPFDRQQEAFRDFLEQTYFIDSVTPTPFPVECQLPYRNVSAALNFLDSRDPDKPFFSWVSFAEPHNPYQVPEPYYSLFPKESLPHLASSEISLDEKGPRFAWIEKVWREILGADPERISQMRACYHGMLRLIDDQFGRLLDGLDERGLSENTIVLYLSDHGDFAGEYGLMRKGPDLPDVLTHIPMVWRIPGFKPIGRLDTGFANIVDVLPTLCDLLDLPIPYGVQGKSLCPLLRGEDCPKEFETALSESGYGGLYWQAEDTLDLFDEGARQRGRDNFDCLNSWTQSGQVRMIVKGDYKLQTDMLGNSYLYNLRNDPVELHNLWEVDGYEEVKVEMLSALASALLRADDPLPPPRSRYRVKRHPKNYQFQPFTSDGKDDK